MKKFLIVFFLIMIFTTNLNCVRALDLSALLGGQSTDVNLDPNVEASKGEKVTTAINLDTKATYNLSSDFIYEGVLFDSKFPQKKYTYIKNLDVMILYGNRSLLEEMQKYMPWMTEETFKSTFSASDMKDIIANAAGSDTSEVLYGNNKFYETTKTQEVEKKGKKVQVNSIVDMYFEDDYIYSFSYTYVDKQDGLKEYQEALRSFKVLSEDESNTIATKGKQELALEQEKLEKEKREQEEVERKAQEEAELKAKEEADKKAQEEAELKAKEEAEKKAQEEAELKTKEEAEKKAQEEAEQKAKEEAEKKAQEEAEQKAKEEAEKKAQEEAEQKAKEETEKKAQEVEKNQSLENTLNEANGNILSGENNERVAESVAQDSNQYTEKTEPVEDNNNTESSEEFEGPIVLSTTKKRSLPAVILGIIWNNPALRILVIVLLCVDITIFILLRKRRAKKKAEKEEAEKKKEK